MRTIQEIIQRIRAEYLEMPGLQLTADQLQRLCGIERTVCEAVLESLVSDNFLWMKSDGRYARLTHGTMPRPKPASAHLRTNGDSLKAQRRSDASPSHHSRR
jgi:hypothetical protein